MILQLWSVWLEEVFADICGELMLGPACVQSLMKHLRLQIRETDDRRYNDRVHPIIHLRPLLQIKALRLANEGSNNELGKELDKLEQAWKGVTGAKAARRQYASRRSRTAGHAVGGLEQIAEAVIEPMVDLFRFEPKLYLYDNSVHSLVVTQAQTLFKSAESAQPMPMVAGTDAVHALSVAWYAWQYLIDDTDTELDRPAAINRLSQVVKDYYRAIHFAHRKASSDPQTAKNGSRICSAKVLALRPIRQGSEIGLRGNC